MFIQSESGIWLRLDCIEEIGVTQPYPITGLANKLFCDVVAYGVGTRYRCGVRQYADRNRYIVQHKSYEVSYDYMRSLSAAIKEGKPYWSALEKP